MVSVPFFFIVVETQFGWKKDARLLPVKRLPSEYGSRSYSRKWLSGTVTYFGRL